MKVRLEQNGEIWGTLCEDLFGRLVVRGPQANREGGQQVPEEEARDFYRGGVMYRLTDLELLRSLPNEMHGPWTATWLDEQGKTWDLPTAVPFRRMWWDDFWDGRPSSIVAETTEQWTRLLLSRQSSGKRR